MQQLQGYDASKFKNGSNFVCEKGTWAHMYNACFIFICLGANMLCYFRENDTMMPSTLTVYGKN